MSEPEEIRRGEPKIEDPIDLAVLGLDDLAYLPLPALWDIYARARVPRIGDLEGPMRGLFLASAYEPEGLRRFLAGISRSPLFLWRGKSFQAPSGGEGAGINRFFSEGKPFFYFPFHVHLRTSRVGSFQAVELDYNVPKNPSFVRRVRDELRQINERVYLGLWYLELLGKERFIAFFGLERRPN